MRKLMTVMVALILFAGTSAFALSLEEAKKSGQLGETPSGYLEPVGSSPSAEALSVMNDINSRRRAQYQSIAKKNGTALGAVEALAGKKAIENTPQGQYVKANGKWIKR